MTDEIILEESEPPQPATEDAALTEATSDLGASAEHIDLEISDESPSPAEAPKGDGMRTVEEHIASREHTENAVPKWLEAAARTRNRWAIGKRLTDEEFEKGLELTKNIAIGGS